MSAPPSSILLSASGSSPLAWQLQATGFGILPHTLGATAAVDFEPVAVALVEPGERPQAAASQTRRWRIELGDTHVPVYWLTPRTEHATLALDSGADACLVLPVEPAVLTAQVRAGLRTRAAFAQQAARAAEARLLGDQLQKAHREADLTLDLARRAQRAGLPRTLPTVGAARFSVCHQPRARAGGDFYGIEPLDENHVAFFVADTVSHTTSIGCVIGSVARQAILAKDPDTQQILPPDVVLARVNRELLALGLEDPPFVAMLYGVLNGRTGDVDFARAGLPPPVYLPTVGTARSWTLPGPFLGVCNAEYFVYRARLEPGDRLAIGSDGTRPGADTIPAADGFTHALETHREQHGHAYLEAVTKELQATIAEPDDFTLMVIEMERTG